MEPKVSVIIPVYNVENFLQECIDSLVRQTLEEIELIFVNDASPDKSLEILEHNRKEYPDKIQIINSKVNLRQGGARNLGIKAARAEYIGFVDSDDFVDKDMYCKMYEKIKKTDSDAVFVQCAAVSENATLMSVEANSHCPHIMWNERILRWDNKELSDEGRQDLICYPLSGIWGGLWRKSIFIDNDLYFPEKLRYEDNYWASLTMCYLKKVSFIQNVHYFYRQSTMSTVHKKNAEHHFDRITIEKMLLDEIKNRGMLDKYKDAFEYIYIKRYMMNTFNTLIGHFDTTPISKLDDIRVDLKRNFPKWRKNFYLRQANKKEKIKSFLYVFPTKWIVKILKIKRLLKR